MFFIDFNKKKIVKEFNYHTQQINIELPSVDISVDEIKNICSLAIMNGIVPSDNATLYEFNLQMDRKVFVDTPFDAEQYDQFFYTVMNILLATFFNLNTTYTARKDEYRLDVPEIIKKYARVSLSMLKKGCNFEMRNNIVNITCIWDTHNSELGTYTYDILDQDFQSIDEMTLNTIERTDDPHESDELIN